MPFFALLRPLNLADLEFLFGGQFSAYFLLRKSLSLSQNPFLGEFKWQKLTMYLVLPLCFFTKTGDVQVLWCGSICGATCRHLETSKSHYHWAVEEKFN